MKVQIEGTTYEMTRAQARVMLTKKAFKLVNRVHRQGGTVNLGIGAFTPEYRAMIS